MTSKTVIIALAALSLASCNDSKQEPGKVDSPKITIIDSAGGMKTLNADNSSKSLQNVLLKKIEEGAFPLATIDGELSDGRKISFNFNQEDEAYKGPGLKDIIKNTGKHITVVYVTTMENSALHIVMNNRDILDGKAFKMDNTDEKTSGILMAAAITGSDLPDTFHIKKEDGSLVAFPYFITAEMVKANGKNVDVYYRKDEINTVKEIQLIKE